MRYRTKVDWWIGCSILAGMLLPIASAIQTGALWMYAVPAGIWILVLGFLYPQSYEVAPQGLIVRAGVTRKTIPYAEITSVSPTNDTRSSMAMSLDRVRIEYARGALLISPAQQDAFIADIAAHAPHLSRRGYDLTIALDRVGK